MTTAEATIGTLNRLNESNFLKASRYIERLFERQKRKTKPGLKVYTKEEFIALLDRADEDIKAGRVYTLEEVEEMTRQKYGF
ncbi:hypothetical protein IJ103_02580 [Candidatus Saccharibacteria bacterium]|nr:hypothetical protein [Candidatus Saccharibacteria bacterium]MBQ9017106.1 hypothetical protein [Candidatus Saccharibacteria bacterium]